MSNHKKLTRSYSSRILSGVCGGIAEYFDVDASIVRLAWIFFSLLGGSGILAYLICIFVIPTE